ncbi:MAG: hypothetical protein J0M09_03415 [Xanthomonadales bacterium]|nr:hypothetical protein [Xanthomonadales bacterium]
MSERNLAAAATVGRNDNRCEWRPKPKRPHCKCISTDQPPKRPDPAIYSQRQRLSQGLSTSWESPDIQTNWWDDWRLMDSILVRVHNESNEASAVNTLVQVRWAQYGIGTVFSSLGDQLISLGYAPDAKDLAFPINGAVRALGNDVSIEVRISHPHDKVADNNLGYQAIHGVRTSQVGKSPSKQFAVLNASAATETITLVVLANDIGGAVTPTSRVFAPGEQITATLTTNVPGSIVPPAGDFILKEATVVGYDSSGRLLGGVTFLVRVDS